MKNKLNQIALATITFLLSTSNALANDYSGRNVGNNDGFDFPIGLGIFLMIILALAGLWICSITSNNKEQTDNKSAGCFFFVMLIAAIIFGISTCAS